jgi:hypothetical protein
MKAEEAEDDVAKLDGCQRLARSARLAYRAETKRDLGERV